VSWESSAGWDAVCALGLQLPEVEESTYYTHPALKLRGAFIAGCKDGENLVLPVSFARRDELLAEEAEVFHLTEHYAKSKAVLVRLDVVEPERLRELLEESWRAAGGGSAS
jgi:hypothetical protein